MGSLAGWAGDSISLSGNGESRQAFELLTAIEAKELVEWHCFLFRGCGVNTE
jgi:hypothetical protein